jgi:c-di-GMP-binding flagellar brake protein YcgR
MRVRLGALLEVPTHAVTAPMLRVCNLSGSGMLVRDPDHLLTEGRQVRLGLPIGPSGEIVRLQSRVVRVQSSQGTAGVCFEEITESVRLVILRYLFKEHRKRKHRSRRGLSAAIMPLERT